jgi:hypothetical protein
MVVPTLWCLGMIGVSMLGQDRSIYIQNEDLTNDSEKIRWFSIDMIKGIDIIILRS